MFAGWRWAFWRFDRHDSLGPPEERRVASRHGIPATPSQWIFTPARWLAGAVVGTATQAPGEESPCHCLLAAGLIRATDELADRLYAGRSNGYRRNPGPGCWSHSSFASNPAGQT